MKNKERNPPNLYRRGDSWIYDFYCKGVRFTKNLGRVSRTVAKEEVAKAITKAAEGRLERGPVIEDLVFETAMEKYLEWYKANRGEYTYLKYALSSSRALVRFFKGKRLSHISPFLIEAFKLDRKRGSDREHPDHAKAVADATVNRELTLLKHLFNLAVKWRFAKVNPMINNVELFKEDNGRTRYLDHDEAERLLLACNQDLRLVVLAAMKTGFRSSELKSLEWSSVDLTNGSVTVQSCYSKNDETRTVPLTDDLAKALRKIKEKRKPDANDHVFLLDGKPWKDWREAFNGALRRAGISNFRFHDLRHCYGSWLAMINVSDKGRMELMGHKDPKMTMRYTHLSMDYKSQAVQKLPKFGKDIMEAESQQISQQAPKKKVVKFRK